MRSGLAAALLSLATTGALAAQTPARRSPPPTTADYARADSIFLVTLRKPGVLRNGEVIPHWIGRRDEFWYRHERAGGWDIVMVDAATGRKRPAFDWPRLAAASGEAGGARVSVDSIPLDSLRDVGADARDAFLTVSGKVVRCALSNRDVRCEALAPARTELAVSPDGRLAAFTKNFNLWLRDLATGAERALTTDGASADLGYGIYSDNIGAIPRRRLEARGRRPPPFGVAWSPDSRTVIVTRVDQRHVSEYPFLESVPADGSFRPRMHLERRPLLGEQGALHQLFAIDVATARARPVGPPIEESGFPRTIRRSWWSADGRHFYALAPFENETVARLLDVDVGTGETRVMVEERATPRFDTNSGLYNAPNVHVTANGRDVIWWSQRDGWGHLYRYDGASGRLLNRITTGPWLVRDILAVDERARRIYFTASGREPGNPYYRHIYRVDFDGRGLTHLSPESGDHNVVSIPQLAAIDGAVTFNPISPSGAFLVYNVSTPSRPTETLIRRTADASIVATIEKADPSALHALGYRPPEEFTVKAADGVTDLWGIIYRPANFDSTLSYPVIDAEYTSPMVAVAARNFVTAAARAPNTNAAAYARLGFIAVVLDSRGTPFRDRAFNLAMYGRLDAMGLDDHVAAIKQLARRHAYIDTTRVGITGDSFGGWSTIRALLDYPDFFKVGVAGSAPGAFHNMYSFAPFQGLPEYGPGEVPNAPNAVPKNYVALDNRKQVERLEGKLMMTVSELDENVLPGSTLQLVDALLRADKNVDVVYLPDTGHGAGRYTGHVIRRSWDYFVRHLMDAEPPPYRLRFP